VAATRKLGVDAGVAQQKVELMSQMRVVRFRGEDVIAAIEVHRLTKYSFWDSMIIHAVRLSGAKVLFSKDLQAGGKLPGGARVVDPFVANA
jgi:predicted nucleic acid-binding protein